MWRELWTVYGGRITGVAAALFLGFIYLFAGFWDMLFVALLLWIGYYVGKQRDLSADPFQMWQQLVDWLQRRWRMFRR
ncbi:DUF2273 domain-containing protein [Paenibacillus sp. SYP-B4298]|uniref:DUF2273 domain-containing protein n=1 Tax=Paenibacillus sp. SYP-B4298 TaxID=2996034 RepID=UPI0022DD9208|nr:DUF2273 domain-containing protein [Paenibacillus sp. SYP-B4298]